MSYCAIKRTDANASQQYWCSHRIGIDKLNSYTVGITRDTVSNSLAFDQEPELTLESPPIVENGTNVVDAADRTRSEVIAPLPLSPSGSCA
ncbi:hypothetical protein [Bradyrhizobium cenepequi]